MSDYWLSRADLNNHSDSPALNHESGHVRESAHADLNLCSLATNGKLEQVEKASSSGQDTSQVFATEFLKSIGLAKEAKDRTEEESLQTQTERPTIRQMEEKLVGFLFSLKPGEVVTKDQFPGRVPQEALDYIKDKDVQSIERSAGGKSFSLKLKKPVTETRGDVSVTFGRSVATTPSQSANKDVLDMDKVGGVTGEAFGMGFTVNRVITRFNPDDSANITVHFTHAFGADSRTVKVNKYGEVQSMSALDF